jgi:cytochrome c556
MPSLKQKTRTLLWFLLAGAVMAQAPSYTPKPYGNLKQVMRSVALPNSDIIFGVQEKLPKTDMEWQAVVNAAVAIEELENLVMIPGRIRSNGQPVPVQNADYAKYAAALAPAGRDCLKASLQKNKDSVSNCTDSLSQACDNCHKVYRDAPQK